MRGSSLLTLLSVFVQSPLTKKTCNIYIFKHVRKNNASSYHPQQGKLGVQSMSIPVGILTPSCNRPHSVEDHCIHMSLQKCSYRTTPFESWLRANDRVIICCGYLVFHHHDHHCRKETDFETLDVVLFLYPFLAISFHCCDFSLFL